MDFQQRFSVLPLSCSPAFVPAYLPAGLPSAELFAMPRVGARANDSAFHARGSQRVGSDPVHDQLNPNEDFINFVFDDTQFDDTVENNGTEDGAPRTAPAPSPQRPPGAVAKDPEL